MTLRLLPTSEIKDRKAGEQARDIIRTQELNKASDEARKKLANTEADFKDTLARQRLQWAQGEEEHAKRVQEMDVEVKVLEKRKEQALIPIEIYSKQADEKMSEALECLDLAKVRESEAEELSEKLQDKLDSVGQREQDVLKKEKELMARTQNVEHQEAIIQSNSKSISDKWSELSEYKKAMDKELFNKNEGLILREQSLLSKEESLKRTEENLNSFEIRLNDERETLARAFARLKSVSPLPEKDQEV